MAAIIPFTTPTILLLQIYNIQLYYEDINIYYKVDKTANTDR